MKLRSKSRSAPTEDPLPHPHTPREPKKTIRTHPPEVNKKLCEGCAKCCLHINHEIDPPHDDEDCDYIIWFLLHENLSVWVDDENVWYLEFKTPCKALHNELCSIYEKRPQVCREYEQETCLNTDLEDDIIFHTPEEFLAYVKKNNLCQYTGFYREHKKITLRERAKAFSGQLGRVLFLATCVCYGGILAGLTAHWVMVLLLSLSCATVLAVVLGSGKRIRHLPVGARKE